MLVIGHAGPIMRRRLELAGESRERVRDTLAGKAGDPGRTAGDRRLFANAVLCASKFGIPWANLPELFGEPNTGW